MSIKNNKVYVGMSGGVDSSLAASLLIEQGYDVTGVYMKNWTRDMPGAKCPWAHDLADAKRVAVSLGINFKIYDFENEYKQQVVDYMIEEYRNGHTPNPDIICNQEVKFKLFFNLALADGADLIATGHYARTEKGLLKKAADDNKDQTYFLYRVSSQALDKTIFPVGDYTKPQVRDMAIKRGLATANKKDSQGICFVGKVGIRDFLAQYIDIRPGRILDKNSGDQLGYHEGAILYTLGQRHGLDIGGGLPYYVVGKDMEKNEVYVTTDLNDSAIWKKQITLTKSHWIDCPPSNGEYQVRIRHRAPLVAANINIDKDIVYVEFDNQQRAVTPGQSVVVYDGILCLGGGIVA